MQTRYFNEANLAVVSLLYSATLWGLIWYPLRLLDEAGMTAVWTSLVMYVAASLVSLPFLFKKHSPFIHRFRDLLILAISAGYTNLAFLVALSEGEVMRVILLFYLSPIWSVLIGRVWLAEKLSKKSWLLFCLAMIGAIVMLWNPEIGAPWPNGLGDWLAITAGFTFAINIVSARKLAEVSLTIKTITVWWGVALFSAAVLLFQSSELPQVSMMTWSTAFLLGAIGMVTMNIAVLYGLAKMPVYRSSVIMLFELIVAALSAWWLVNEVMNFQEWLGGGLILLAGYWLVKQQN